jgi:hypothetical protein
LDLIAAIAPPMAVVGKIPMAGGLRRWVFPIGIGINGGRPLPPLSAIEGLANGGSFQVIDLQSFNQLGVAVSVLEVE